MHDTRSYKELSSITTFEDRLAYLRIKYKYSSPDHNNPFYKSDQWKQIRYQVISRDFGFDLGIPGVDIKDKVTVHHIVPLTQDDLDNMTDKVTSLDNLITCSHKTHMAIHYGGERRVYKEREPNDTKLW